MKIVDVNILIYVVSRQSDFHDLALKWWTMALRGNEPVGLCWHSLVGFTRIMTSSRIFPQPVPLDQCVDRIDAWLEHPNIRLVQQTKNHWTTLRSLLFDHKVKGNLVADAHLAALAISQGATLVSFDTDFSRFAHLRWENPNRR